MTVQAKAARPNRMSLANLVRGRQDQPVRVVLYGVEGIGKSTFAAGAPNPVFIAAEDGTAQLDIPRFPMPDDFKYQDVLDAIETLATESHDFQTIAIDTLDWLEPLIWRRVCERDGKQSIEDFGFGRGYVAALDEWRILLAALERLRRARSMHVVLVAHSSIKAFRNPEGEDFDRYEMKLNAKASALVKEWADLVLFATYETFAVKNERTKRVKGISTGARIMHTVRTAAWDAKSRYPLPEQMALSWADLVAGVAAQQPADPDELIAAIAENAKRLPDDMQKQTAESLKRCGKDATKLAQLDNWVRCKVPPADSPAEGVAG